MSSSAPVYVELPIYVNEERTKTAPRTQLEGQDVHLLAILAAIVGGIAVWYFHIRALRDAGSEAIDALSRVRGAYSRYSFKKKSEGSVLTTIEDPALAATVFLYALAGEGTIDDRVEAEIRRQVSTIAAHQNLDEMIAYGAWAARSVVDARDCVRRFKTLWKGSLTVVERKHLVSMAVAVRGAAAKPAHVQHLAVETLQTALMS